MQKSLGAEGCAEDDNRGKGFPEGEKVHKNQWNGKGKLQESGIDDARREKIGQGIAEKDFRELKKSQRRGGKFCERSRHEGGFQGTQLEGRRRGL